MTFTNPYPASRLTVDATNSLSSGLVGFWPLTDGTGTTAKDITSNANDGTVAGTTSWTADSIGNVLDLDGASGHVSVGDWSLDSSTSFTVSAWIVPDSLLSNKQIVTRDNAGGSRHWQFRVSSGNQLELIRFNSSDGVIETITASTAMSTGTAYFVCFTFDSTTGSVLYLNGASDGSSVDTTANNSGTGTDILLGARRSSGTLADFFSTKIQNVRIYNRALSATEVATLYNRPWEGTNYGDLWPYSPPVPSSATLSTDTAATSLMSGCVGWWPLTDGSGTTATDIVGPNDGTLVDVTWGLTEVGNNTEYPSASGDYVTTTLDLAGESAITVSAWIRNDGDSAGYSFGKIVTQSQGGAFDTYMNKSSNVSLTLDINTTTVQANNADIPAIGEWFHVCFVWEQSTTQAIYINGEVSVSGTADTSVIGSTTHNVYFGGTNAATRPWDGGIQNVRIWNRALTADEVTLLYERPWEGLTYGDEFHYDPPTPASLTPLDNSSGINNSQVGWWPLTETDDYASGAADISANGNHGTQTGGVLSAVSPLGGVASFDGVDDKIGVSNAYTYSSLTVSFWLRDDFDNSGDYVADRTLGSIGSYGGFSIGANGETNRFRFFLDSGSTSYILLDAARSDILSQGVWHFITLTFDSVSQSLSAYVDGVDATSLFTNTTVGTLGSITSSGVLTIGNRPGTTTRATNSDISNVRMWSRALSEAEVWSIYENPWLGSAYSDAAAVVYQYILRSKRFRRL